MRTLASSRSLLTLAALAGAALAVGCTTSEPTATAPRATTASATTGVADHETAARRWNVLTQGIVSRRLPDPLRTARTFALVSVAQYDAVVAAGSAKERGVHPSEAGAASAAAATVLAALFPVEQGVIDAQRAADAAYFPALPTERDASFAAGEVVGRAVAAAVLARAATDGSGAAGGPVVAPVGPGYWYSAPPPAVPVLPRWSQVRPWLMTSGDEYRPPPPPAFGSPEFVAALAEVRHLSDTRTPEQLAIAQKWGVTTNGGPMGYWSDVALTLADAHHLDELHATRMLAIMHMATMDASIGCWDGKFTYWYVRPFQADPAITTPVGRPNFPSYPSAHSCFSSAAAGVIAGLFPEASDDVSARVQEAGVARMYAGLHFRFDVAAGQDLGYAIAALALRKAPRGHESIPLD